MTLDLMSIKKAVDSHERITKLALSKKNEEGISDLVNEALQIAVVQTFEFTYELCWKFMKRWLEFNLTPGMMEGVTRKQLFRYAAENSLITDFETWVIYQDMRNKTSQTYI